MKFFQHYRNGFTYEIYDDEDEDDDVMWYP